MRTKSRKIFRLLAIALFAVGTMTTVVGYLMKHSRMHPQPAFTMTSEQIFTGPDGKSWLNAVKVRLQRADGAWKEVTTYYKPDGGVLNVKTRYSIYQRGVFEVNEQEQKLLFVGPRLHQVHQISEAEVRKNPEFVREDAVLGYTTLVQHYPDEEGSGYSETHIAPGLGGAIVKVVFTNPDGSYTTVVATKIELGEPDANKFGEIPSYPVSYEFFEQKIQATESSGDKSKADQMRQLLEKQKQGHQ